MSATLPPTGLRNLSLKTKLLLMMLSLLLLSASTLFLLHLYSERRLISQLKDYTEDLSTAIEVFAAQPAAVAADDPKPILDQYAQKLRQLGVKVPITSYTAAYNPQMAKQLGTQADGLIVASMAPGVADLPAVAAYVERWKKEKGREPNNVPVTQYLYDGAYIIKALIEHLDKTNRPLTGENLRKALLEVKTFKLPLTGDVTINENHTVLKPVYLVEVKGGAFVPLRMYR